jgi:hypothetical protein
MVALAAVAVVICYMGWLLLVPQCAKHPDYAHRNALQRMMDILPGYVDSDGAKAMRHFQCGLLPADMVSSLTECRLRETYGMFQGGKFYSFKIPSNAVARIVSGWPLARYDNWRNVPPDVKGQPPWWDAIAKEWPPNAEYYAGAYAHLWYLPDSQLCLFRLVR